MKQLILAAAILVATITTADAQRRTPVINNRAHRQEMRIQQGRHSGALSRAEAYRLQRQHALIRRDVRMARADGRVSARERAIIRQRQAIASRSIYRQKHDYQYRR
jgi:uncharacterized membrane protein YebE (DUF533 family)